MNNIYGCVSDYIYVYKQFIPKNIYEDLNTQVIIQDNGLDRNINIPLFENINQDIVAIPRYCPFGTYLLENNLLQDQRCEGEDIDISINVTPRDHFQEEAISSILTYNNGIICAKTAFGKTYVAINAISKLKKKTLIFMHKRDLMQQWKDDILRYTNLKDDDVQIFTGSNFKRGKAITITSVQNISAKIRLNNMDLRQIFYEENFGITIFDECHVSIGPLVHSQAARWTFSKRIYGLSATPKRGDGFDKIIRYLIGDIIYTDNRKMLPVYVSFAPVSVEVPNNIKYYLSKSEKQYTIRYNKWLM